MLEINLERVRLLSNNDDLATKNKKQVHSFSFFFLSMSLEKRVHFYYTAMCVWLFLTQGGWWKQLKGVYETVSQERMLPCSSRPNKRAIYYIQHDPLITHK